MPRYSFGPFSLDSEARILLRSGKPVPLAGKTLDTLLVLVENRGRLVDKDELLARVWPGAVVEEANLSQGIYTLRKLLGDSPKDHRYIATVAGRGYQFVAPVTESANGSPASGQPKIAKRTWQLAAAVAASLVLACLLVFWNVLRPRTAKVGELKVRQLTTNPQGNLISGAILSPDGKYLAYSSAKNIYLRAIATGDTHPLPRPESLGNDIWFPVAWFPDGVRILASSFKRTADDRVFTAWSVPLLAGSPIRLRENAFAHAVSPDGSLIAFAAGRAMPECGADVSWSYLSQEIWVMDAHGENARRVFVAEDDRTFFASPRFSPDGRRLAYTKYTVPDRGFAKTSIESRDFAGGPPICILPESRELTFDWASDGRLFYSLPEPAPNINDWNLWAVSIDSKSGKPKGRPQRITAFPGFGLERISLSADGKKLAFVRGVYYGTTHLAELAPGYRIRNLRRLTLSESDDSVYTWTRDSQSVIFISNRSGTYGLYKQRTDNELAEPIPTGAESVRVARTSPDGEWLVYSAFSNAADPGRSHSALYMRVPISGGTPRKIFETQPMGLNFDCPRRPNAPCLLEEWGADRNHVVFCSFDPARGRMGEVWRSPVAPGEGFQMTVSPDGSRFVAISNLPAKRQIRILSRTGKLERAFELKGWPHPDGVDWTADGNALLVSFANPAGAMLARVDLEGHVQPLYTLPDSNFIYGVASPDGRYLAIGGSAFAARNVWMLENF